MAVKKAYCGLMLIAIENFYICVDRYTEQVKCSGSYEECNKYFNEYVERIRERS